MNINTILRGEPGYSSYGASMGRGSYADREAVKHSPLHLQRVYLFGDYDAGGAYWGGGGEALYCAFDEDGRVRWYVRSYTREGAKRELVAQWPEVRFYK